MNKFIELVNKYVAPFAQRLSRIVWIAGLQDAIMITLPLTLVGSVVSVISILNEFIPGMPDFSPISTFSFGIMGLVLAFVYPVFILQRKKLDHKKYLAGVANVGLFIMLTVPQFDDLGRLVLDSTAIGSGGMFLAIVSGIVTALIFMWLEKLSFFKNSDTIPEYVVSSFDAFIPILLIVSLGYLVIYGLNVNFFEMLTNMLMPLTAFGQSYLGILSYVFVATILYSFGISPWLLYGLFYPIQLAGIAENAALVAQGLAPVHIHTGEVVQALITIGGMGVTLPLAVMLMRSHSRRLKAIGQAGIVPSLLNINEPIVFGTPILLNPLLMIPFWANSFLSSTIVYFALKANLVNIPSQIFNLWFMPTPFQAYFATGNDWRAIILVIVVLTVATAVYYPFFKAYEKTEIARETENLNDGN